MKLVQKMIVGLSVAGTLACRKGAEIPYEQAQGLLNNTAAQTADTSYTYIRSSKQIIRRVIVKRTRAGTELSEEIRCGFNGSLEFALIPDIEYGRWITYENPHTGQRLYAHAGSFSQGRDASLCDSIGVYVQQKFRDSGIRPIDIQWFTISATQKGSNEDLNEAR